jgi:GGDEF domain-containing protein
VVVAILVGAMALLIWNGNSFVQRLSIAEGEFSNTLKIAAVALCLNVALILFGWRRYADLQHETDNRIDGETRAEVAASTDGMTGLLNRKGFGDKGASIAARAAASGSHIAVISIQLNRFKTINDRFGYDVGDAVLRRLSTALEADTPRDAALARLSGGEFAVMMAIADQQEALGLAERLLRRLTTPLEEEG